MGNVGIIIQARLGSTRFPRKISSLLGGRSILQLCVDRAKKLPDVVVSVCAPQDEEADPFWVKFNGCNVSYGSHNNLLRRYLKAAEEIGVQEIVRLTADNPFFSVSALTATVEARRLHNLDYISSKADDGAWLPHGVGCECFTIDALRMVVDSRNKIHQEHVSEAFLENEKICSYVLVSPLDFCSEKTRTASLTIDFPEQLELLNELLCIGPQVE